MGSQLFGQAPKATFSTQPTILPQQQSLLDALAAVLGTGQLPAGLQGPAGATVADVLSGPTEAAQQSTRTGQALVGEAQPTIADLLSGGASTRAFREGVVQPMTEDFLSRTLPAIAGNYGRGAGGSFGSEAAEARGAAATDLERVLASEGAKYALGGQQAGLSAIPGLAGASATTASTANVPFNDIASLLQLFLGGATTPTQQTLGVGTGGTTGLIPGFFGGAGGSAIGTALGNWLF